LKRSGSNFRRDSEQEIPIREGPLGIGAIKTSKVVGRGKDKFLKGGKGKDLTTERSTVRSECK